ncbi:flagellar basal body-associated FliL family protein [Salipiger mangrovisoli]|uniref:Flagellar protein FliL n=1 Tax=Salipiger mangrovisoli TaxID=2865933 RepID=A0ABR9WXC7_9RHOB|nr:flagellar basal body-associated FliL family protein [Salipiger mangrovisoli]MBE9635912.1 flagellar basal body-associated FliL family protein [Salipiger mangrovisoli]
MKKLLPLLLALLGTAAGVGAGIFLAPGSGKSTDHAPAPAGAPEHEGAAPSDDTDPHAPAADHAGPDHAEAESDGHGGETEYVKLNNQFVVPVVEDARVGALVVLSISLEVTAGSAAGIFDAEPKLRDGFLRTLFDHANIGGFDGNFTETPRMESLRRVLFETARNILGPRVKDVLITDIARQDN